MFGPSKSKKKPTQAKILIVDDEADLISTVQCHIKWYGYDVITATNGKEGLEKAVNEKPDLVLLDISMPVMNGHEMLERLRKHPDLKDIPVIMLTALCEAEDIAKVSSYDIADYVTKPFDFTELMGKIATALENKKTLSNV
jgi:DNA-binding response OmpR family regulator